MPWRDRVRRVGNRAYLRAARSRGSHVATSADGLVYVVDVRDRGPGGALLLDGATPELDILPRALTILDERAAPRRRSWFVDVGANIGTTVVPAVARHGFERAIAIEPEPENVRVLRANVALNAVGDRVEVVAAAAGEVKGEAAFRRGRPVDAGWRAGAGALAIGRPAGPGDPTVAVVTVDSILAERAVAPADVGLLWLDVQGHEGSVLKGAETLLRDRAPVVFALRGRKLAKAGTLDYTLDTIEATYSHVVDLRPADERGTWQRDVRPASALREIVASRRTTDVLAFSGAD